MNTPNIRRSKTLCGFEKKPHRKRSQSQTISAQAPHAVTKRHWAPSFRLSSCVWQSCRVRYLFFHQLWLSMEQHVCINAPGWGSVNLSQLTHHPPISQITHHPSISQITHHPPISQITHHPPKLGYCY